MSAAVEHLRRHSGRGISDAVNELVRRGLAAPAPRPPFRQESSDLGRSRLAIDDVAGLLDTLEGDDRGA